VLILLLPELKRAEAPLRQKNNLKSLISRLREMKSTLPRLKRNFQKYSTKLTLRLRLKLKKRKRSLRLKERLSSAILTLSTSPRSRMIWKLKSSTVSSSINL